MSKVIPRPQLKPNANYALQCTSGQGWLANTMPMTCTTDERERKTFTGAYLNETCFNWHYSHNAVEIKTVVASKPRPVAPPTPKHHKKK